MKRAVATITVYVYGETVVDLKDKAKYIEESINRAVQHDAEAKVEQLHEVPFGKIGIPTPIKFERS